MSVWGQINLMDPASPIQSEMILFHDHAMILLIGVFTLVGTVGVSIMLSSFTCRTIHEAQTLETVWTVVPALLLIWLALPSLRLLYTLDEHSQAVNTLKSIGHQWYWSYEDSVVGGASFDSYMIREEDLEVGMFRLLEVDARPILPLNLNTNVMTTSADVIHAWALPSMGMKMDSVPGRLNSMNMKPLIPGVYYGQCSEICGANHSFMPIAVEVVSPESI
uniref:Cytochrome c oxidase subunit 2 n=2 Tax=Cerion TaxID=145431 RepID=A0A8K2ARA8_9EUPU|nr:cytochrome c oxidase subunit II [Cerion coloni]YP_010383226.1 cytochrome c oxidase subunit II [Cerion watlingense]UEQ12592.1 cytochrome c oxidase subunit II [Cerion coloni]UEQ12605.1 cytochrome c oxidase subunit II [Cerion watlingense]